MAVRNLNNGKPHFIQIKENNGKWKEIGFIKNEMFCRVIKGSKHIFHNTNSIGIDAKIFNQVIKKECDEIRILDSETMKIYVIRVALFDQVKQYLHFEPHRNQVLVKIKHFNQYQKSKK